MTARPGQIRAHHYLDVYTDINQQWRIQDFLLGGGGTEPLGALTSDVSAYQQKTYAKTKRLDPVGGRALAAPPDPPMIRWGIILFAICFDTHMALITPKHENDPDQSALRST